MYLNRTWSGIFCNIYIAVIAHTSSGAGIMYIWRQQVILIMIVYVVLYWKFIELFPFQLNTTSGYLLQCAAMIVERASMMVKQYTPFFLEYGSSSWDSIGINSPHAMQLIMLQKFVVDQLSRNYSFFTLNFALDNKIPLKCRRYVYRCWPTEYHLQSSVKNNLQILALHMFTVRNIDEWMYDCVW